MQKSNFPCRWVWRKDDHFIAPLLHTKSCNEKSLISVQDVMSKSDTEVNDGERASRWNIFRNKCRNQFGFLMNGSINCFIVSFVVFMFFSIFHWTMLWNIENILGKHKNIRWNIAKHAGRFSNEVKTVSKQQFTSSNQLQFEARIGMFH